MKTVFFLWIKFMRAPDSLSSLQQLQSAAKSGLHFYLFRPASLIGGEAEVAIGHQPELRRPADEF